MRIAFLCSSLEPGRDGVGDYTRRLAEKMLEYGWKVMCISLNDTEDVYDLATTDFEEPARVNYCRMKRERDVEDKKKLLLTALDFFKPDICSLQLVVYGFHRRGWMRSFNSNFAPILANYKIHLMWHELWIGQLTNSTLKEKIEGHWQKLQLFKTLKIIKPKLQHTSVGFYQMLLKKQKIEVKILPLFSNFSLEKAQNFNIYEKLNLVPKQPAPLLLVSFGTIYSNFPFKQWLADAIEWTKQSGRSIILCSIGKTGSSNKTWKAWEQNIVDEGIESIKLYALGMLLPSEIQSVFTNADVGLSLTPFEGWGKSGSVATMLESGLPVIAYEYGISPFHFIPETTTGLIAFKNNVSNKWPLNFERHAAHSKLAFVCEQFIADLETLITD